MTYVMRRVLLLFALAFLLLPATSRADWPFCSTDPLASRDDYGLLHQMPVVEPTDLAPRYPCRFEYYFMSGEALTTDRGYVGALQRTLFRLGYYCGPNDGVFSVEVSEAIARLQKNHSQRVTGTLTRDVRRALHLP